ncbi:hypothetical protein AG0111_0g11731 [Alternaria gaisen]|uniref:Uncharacterized protein n=2 Tax=Alternaria gaisen TaxID=167740 RepID=A0ACB6F6T2_9PLEO|nr:hypothetical protein AG0111_0g11768 [Alternaria gaisen]KAB2100136.1 hypothetical protein AG0111_0g11731 [Alternaria gaisen]
MGTIPGPLKYIFSWFSGDCKRLRSEISRARQIIMPVIKKRRSIKAQALADGKDIPSFNDAIEWAEAECGGKPYDPALVQLALSVVAIHTTADLLCQTLLYLANDPKLIIPLREEITSVLEAEGWTKNALDNMKLLDSAIKETLRLKTKGAFTIRRLALTDVELPGGIMIHKGERITVDSTNMGDPDIYPEPEKFDIYRFLRMRGHPVDKNKAQLVTTSADMSGFGHGKQACPGRFFSADETKLALSQLLIKYDWKLAPGASVEPVYVGAQPIMNPASKFLYKCRNGDL